jgi:pyruvate/2-oxoglutarate dehydrogenase complex dihydrolipoamide dehydrogenase (E3) component
VIGTGTAAQTAAGRVRRAGRSVAVIDHRPFGGTCALRGCDPKKVLVSGAEAVDFARRMHKRGRHNKNGKHADRCLPILLRMQRLRREPATKTGRLLRVLFLWVGALSANSSRAFGSEGRS